MLLLFRLLLCNWLQLSQRYCRNFIMTHFWNKLQISGLLLTKDEHLYKILKNAGYMIRNVCSNNSRSFFSWRRSDDDKSKNLPTVCGKSLPVRPQPCNPECASKCLCLNVCKDKEFAMRKLSNCRDIEKVEKPKSYWEILFGWKRETPKKKDSRVCRIVECEKRISRQHDPRLKDSRYETTAGDVLIFTERSRTSFCKTQEPQPKPPPAHKLPKAVIAKNIIEQAENNIPNDCAAALLFDMSCEPKCSGPKASILPFEELRPPERQRKLFSCKTGIRSKDVSKPIRSVTSNISTNNNAFADAKTDKNICSELSMDSGSRGNSRIEQLKKLIRAKDGCKSPEIFVNNTSINVSQCRTPCNTNSTNKLSNCPNDSSEIK